MADPLITDGDFELLSAQPDAGTSTWVRYNPDGTVTLRKTIMWEQYLEANAQARSLQAGQKWGDGKVVSSVPLGYALRTGYAEAMRDGDTKWKQKFLNDRDNYKLRTFEGKL